MHVFRPLLRTAPTSDLVARVARNISDGRHRYCPDVATLFAIACGWSYGDGQTLADVLHRCGFEGTCRRISVASGALFVDTDAYVITDHDFAVVVFRGTEIGDAKIIDALSDFYSRQVPFYGGEDLGVVHYGFQQAYLPVHDHIVDVLRGEAAHVPSVFFSGHSLGGALAVLAMASLYLAGNGGLDDLTAKVRGLYTYGQPMVGDRAFAYACREKFGPLTFRHVYQRDLVPRLPPRWSTGEFAHFGAEYRGTEDGGWVPSEKSVEQVMTAVVPLALAATGFVASQVKGLRGLALQLPYSLDDHRPQAYIDCSKRSTGDIVFP